MHSNCSLFYLIFFLVLFYQEGYGNECYQAEKIETKERQAEQILILKGVWSTFMFCYIDSVSIAGES